MRAVRCLLVWSLLTACAPPPKVAGYSREGQEGPAPPASPARAVAAPPPKSSESTPPPPGPLLHTPPADVPKGQPAPAPQLIAEEQLGDPGGFALEAVSPTGSYVAYCQPTRTSAQKPLDQTLDERQSADAPVALTLALGSERIDLDELLAADRLGRFVVTLESGTPLLRDTVEHRTFPLTSLALDLERDALPDHRAVAFSSDGHELALLTLEGEGVAALVVLDLRASDPTAKPRKVALPARPWRISAEADTFVITTAQEGSKGPNWPVRAWSQPNLRCTRGTFDAFSRLSGPLRDPTLSHSLLGPADKAPRPAPGFVMATPGGWIRREDDGRLVAVQGKQQRQLASARCGGRIVAASATAGWYLVSCEEYRPIKASAPPPKATKKRSAPPKLRFPLYLLKPGVVRDLDAELMRFGVDVPEPTDARYVALRVEKGLLLVDFALGRAELLDPAERVLLTTEREAILSRNGKLVRYAAGQRQELGDLREFDAVLTFRAPASALLVEPAGELASIEAAVGVGSTAYWRRTSADKANVWEAHVLPSVPLAFTARGALVPTGAGTAGRWPRGSVSVVAAPKSR